MEGSYLDHFQAVAWLSEGVLLIVAVLWGAWALLQIPVQWFRHLRWAGAAWVIGNLAMAAWQVSQMGGWSMGATSTTGWMGMDRFLGATAVTWLPILMAWNPWWALPCGLLVALSGKVTAWIGAAVVLWCLYRPKATAIRVAGLVGLGLGIGYLTVGHLPMQIDQRLLTWAHTIHASLVHPLVGWGFGPFSEKAIGTYGYALPCIHSDWLSLAFHGGWPITLLLGWMLWRWFSRAPRGSTGQALRAGLLAACMMTLGQSLVGHARMLCVWVLMAVWLLKEQQEEGHGAPDASSSVAGPGAIGEPIGAPSLG